MPRPKATVIRSSFQTIGSTSYAGERSVKEEHVGADVPSSSTASDDYSMTMTSSEAVAPGMFYYPPYGMVNPHHGQHPMGHHAQGPFLGDVTTGQQGELFANTLLGMPLSSVAGGSAMQSSQFDPSQMALFGAEQYAPVVTTSSGASSASTSDVDMFTISNVPQPLYPGFMFDPTGLPGHDASHLNPHLIDLQGSMNHQQMLANGGVSNFLPFGLQAQGLHHSPPSSAASSLIVQPVSQVSSSQAHHPSTSASANDSCNQIAYCLLNHHVANSDVNNIKTREDLDFVKKAIDSLVKKLKDRRHEMEALLTAVCSNGKTPTNCVTIQRSLDGRLQVAGRKGVPHVVYARIWRWPEVNKNELQKLPICRIQPDNQDYICINPYHYERIVSNGQGAMDMAAPPPVPSTAQFAPAPTPFLLGGDEPMQDDSWSVAVAQQRQQHIDMASAVAPPPTDIFQQGAGTLMGAQGYQELIQQQRRKYDLSAIQIPLTPIFPEYWCTVAYYEFDSQVGDVFKVRREMRDFTIDGGMNPQGERERRFCLSATSNVHRQEKTDKCLLHIGDGVKIVQHGDTRVTLQVKSHKPIFVRAPFLDFEQNFGESRIHRLSAESGEVTVFDLRWSFVEMEEQAQSANAAVVAQARAVAGLPTLLPAQISHDTFASSGVDEMKRSYCTISISFLKGFGSRYPRSSVKECPCWVEITLHRPLQILDQLLKRNYIA